MVVYETKRFLSDFSCPLNADVEDFLKFKAIEFSRQGLAQTHLVMASYRDKPVLVGYFAMAAGDQKVLLFRPADRPTGEELHQRIKQTYFR